MNWFQPVDKCVVIHRFFHETDQPAPVPPSKEEVEAVARVKLAKKEKEELKMCERQTQLMQKAVIITALQ